ncbi:hypothetical protein GQ457_03G021550 [Hibiscus cannabinus]
MKSHTPIYETDVVGYFEGFMGEGHNHFLFVFLVRSALLFHPAFGEAPPNVKCLPFSPYFCVKFGRERRIWRSRKLLLLPRRSFCVQTNGENCWFSFFFCSLDCKRTVELIDAKGMTGELAVLAILVSGGIALQILACALYSNWWPMLAAKFLTGASAIGYQSMLEYRLGCILEGTFIAFHISTSHSGLYSNE